MPWDDGYCLRRYCFVSRSLATAFCPHGGLPMTASKPPRSIIAGNSRCQSKTLALQTFSQLVESLWQLAWKSGLIRALPHLMLPVKSGVAGASASDIGFVEF